MVVRWLAGTFMGLLCIFVTVHGYARYLYPETLHWELFAELIPIGGAVIFAVLCLSPIWEKSRLFAFLCLIVLAVGSPLVAIKAWIDREGIRCYDVPATVAVTPKMFVEEPIVLDENITVCRSNQSDWYLPADFLNR